NHRLRALIGKVGTRPAYPALDLIRHQERVVTVRQLARLGHEFVGQRIDAALALDHLQYDAGGALGEGRLQRRDIVHRNELHTRNQWFEWLPVLGLAGDGKRPQRASVEGILERDNLVLLGGDG